MCSSLREEKAIEREQYYLDLLKPEYNICKTTGSTLGFKHTEETIAKIKGKLKGRTRILTVEHLSKLKASTWTLTAEQQAKRLEALKRLHSSKEHQEHLERLHSIQAQRVQVLDTLTNQLTVYPSISEAALLAKQDLRSDLQREIIISGLFLSALIFYF